MEKETNPEATMAKMRKILERDFSPSLLSLTDESHLHRHHSQKGSGGHFRLHIQSMHFNGKNPVERHRMVYDSLGELMDGEIHALSMKCDAVES